MLSETNLDRIITSNHFAIDYLHVRAGMSEFAVAVAAGAALPLELSADLYRAEKKGENCYCFANDCHFGYFRLTI